MVNENDLISESMEMYLVTISRLKKGDQPVPLSQLAESLSVTPVSVNEMCRKLNDSGYLVYRPYKGAVLTDMGERLANHILRRHRLWEVFLVEKLHFDYEEAHDAACELEHTTADAVIDRLEEYLDFPKVNPDGLSIPTSEGEQPKQTTITLKELPVGSQGHIVRCDVSEQSKRFLVQQGLHQGTLVKIVAASSESVLIDVNTSQVSLSSGIAEKLKIAVFQEEYYPEDSMETNDNNVEKKRNEVSLQMNSETTTTVKHFPLSDLEKGQKAIIVQVGGKGAVKRRMMDMGMVPGSEISVVRKAPFGDPIEYKIKGYSLSLRKSEAKKIMIEIAD